MIKGRDRFENLSAAGGPREAPPVRFGGFVVPAAVAWVVEPIGRSPGVRAEFEMRGGQPVCLSVLVEATPGGRAVTTADLAGMPGLERKALDAFMALGTAVIEDDDWHAGRNLGRSQEVLQPDRRAVDRALKSRSDDELELVARVYRENVETSPLEAVQAALGVSRRTASRRVENARRRGFLPTTTQGKRKA